MQPDKPDLPPGWKLPPGVRCYIWTDPEKRSSPDVYVCKLDEDWEIEYWIDNGATWMTVLVPLTPEPPLELAEALYYAAQ